MPMRKLKNYKPTRFMAETSHYSKQMADFAVMFIEQLTHTKGTWAGQSWPPLSPCSFAAVTVRNAPKSTVALQIDSRPPSFLMLLRIW